MDENEIMSVYPTSRSNLCRCGMNNCVINKSGYPAWGCDRCIKAAAANQAYDSAKSAAKKAESQGAYGRPASRQKISFDVPGPSKSDE